MGRAVHADCERSTVGFKATLQHAVIVHIVRNVRGSLSTRLSGVVSRGSTRWAGDSDLGAIRDTEKAGQQNG